MVTKSLTEQEAIDEVAAALFDIATERAPIGDGWRSVVEIWKAGDKDLSVEALRKKLERKFQEGGIERMAIGRKVYYRILSE